LDLPLLQLPREAHKQKKQEREPQQREFIFKFVERAMNSKMKMSKHAKTEPRQTRNKCMGQAIVFISSGVGVNRNVVSLVIIPLEQWNRFL